MTEKIFPYLAAFSASLVCTLILTPIVREFNRKIGMVDKPDPRRINKVPIPRGGGLALILGVMLPYAFFNHITGRPWIAGLSSDVSIRMTILAFAIGALGYIDDKISLKPIVKLLGQLIIAALVWGWAGLGFSDLWPQMPVWIDCFLTIFWIVGAINAFNLIDGLDGLAAGLAMIATLGMTGALFYVQRGMATSFYFAFIGGLVGFLRYNYNPASVFLGDCGSMFIGFVIATLPLAVKAPNSFLVSIGVPLLAMGVPIFDTALAILRRSFRRILGHQGGAGSGKIMTADTDHLHHRILRSVGMNQRRAALILYALAFCAVSVGLIAMTLKTRAGGLWLVVFTLATILIFRELAKIELFDAGLYLNSIVRNPKIASRRRWARLTIPFYIFADIVMLCLVLLFCCWTLKIEVDIRLLRVVFTIRIATTFIMLIVMRVYQTLWTRAATSNYVRLFFSCTLGAIISSAIIYYIPNFDERDLTEVTVLFAVTGFIGLMGIRFFRAIVRDIFYAIDCSRLRGRKDVSRILVYGAGLRYKAFRRELVRTTAANDRMIVGIVDDNILLRGKYIGGIKIYGTINEIAEIVNITNADSLVIACKVTDEWRTVLKKLLAPIGVKVTEFVLEEVEFV